MLSGITTPFSGTKPICQWTGRKARKAECRQISDHQSAQDGPVMHHTLNPEACRTKHYTQTYSILRYIYRFLKIFHVDLPYPD